MINFTIGLNREYFDWLAGLAGNPSGQARAILMKMHQISFRYSHDMDENRAVDGRNLRYRFVCEQGYAESFADDFIDSVYPCSVLEMMLALALRCEEDFESDVFAGDRTAEWFWHMVESMDIRDMHDVERCCARMMDRAYDPDGHGGLFTIENSSLDMREADIWEQLQWWLNKYIERRKPDA